MNYPFKMSFSLKQERLFVLQVFCVVCCDLRFKLTHLGGKEGRVCVTCHSTLMNRECCGGFCLWAFTHYLNSYNDVISSGTLRKDQKKVWFADHLLLQSESRSANSSPIHRSVSHTERAELAQAVWLDMFLLLCLSIILYFPFNFCKET